jgi:hypothetical protein
MSGTRIKPEARKHPTILVSTARLLGSQAYQMQRASSAERWRVAFAVITFRVEAYLAFWPSMVSAMYERLLCKGKVERLQATAGDGRDYPFAELADSCQ